MSWHRPLFFLALAACVGDAPIDNPIITDSSVPKDSSSGGDASTDAAHPDGSVAWSPATLDGQNQLALWLEASASNITLSSGKVGVWKDLSKNHNDATNNQGGPVVDAVAVNKLDAVHFVTTARLKINDAPSLQFGLDQFDMGVVIKVSATPSYFYSKATSMTTTGGPTYVSGLEVGANTQTIKVDGGPVSSTSPFAHFDPTNTLSWQDPVFDTKFHFVEVRRTNAGSLAMAVDDQAPRTISTGGINLNQQGNGVTLNVAYGNIAPQADFDMAELVIIHGTNGVVSDVDAANLHGYLKQKYAL